MMQLVAPAGEQMALGHVAQTDQQIEQHIELLVHVQARVLAPAVARRKANVWLLMNAGNLLRADNPELVMGELLLWRFDVIRGMPDLSRPGSAFIHTIGRMSLDATTGEVIAPQDLLTNLHANANALTRS